MTVERDKYGYEFEIGDLVSVSGGTDALAVITGFSLFPRRYIVNPLGPDWQGKTAWWFPGELELVERGPAFGKRTTKHKGKHGP